MINNTEYILSDKNFHKTETNKRRIVIGNSFSVDMTHYIGWLNRYNGNYKVDTENYVVFPKDGNQIRLGDEVKVVVKAVDLDRKQIDFELF